MSTLFEVRRLGMLIVAAFSCAVSGCGNHSATSSSQGVASKQLIAACDAGEQSFVRRAFIGVVGRRPASQGEVDAYVDAIGQLSGKNGASSAESNTARLVIVRAMMSGDAFRARWSDYLKDALRVARSQSKSSIDCYGATDDATGDGGALAQFVRDHDAAAQWPSSFTMRELLASSIDLDDLSVVYRAHLFAMLSHPLAGNANAYDLELARRNDFGSTFEATYTQRDVTCLSCHNSAFSVTATKDPATNRFWPVPALFEQALFGSSYGTHPTDDASTHGSDVLRARGMFRYDGVVDSAGVAPYGWRAEACGAFSLPSVDDPLGVDTYFGSLHATSGHPIAGLRSSVWDLERALHRGVDALSAEGLGLSLDGVIEDPDRAFAYVVALTVVEKVWLELVGTPLTIAHHFPRTEVQRDELEELTNGFVKSHFSLKELILEIVAHPAFNLKVPSSGCGGAPYPLPRLFDPWTIAEAEVSQRGNGPSDEVFPLSPRLLRRALHQSLGWPSYAEYPDGGSSEESFAVAIGLFLRDAEPGRRGLDFQGRLAWEDAYGQCPLLGQQDFISRLVDSARVTPGMTVRAAVETLKDRLTGSSGVGHDEQTLIESLIGTTLDSSDLNSLEPQLRRFCGALVASPWFLLGGVVAQDGHGAPPLTALADSYGVACAVLRTRLLAAGGAGGKIKCAE